MLGDLDKTYTNGSRIIAVTGLGGTGKTQAIKTYALKVRERYQGGIFFIEAQTQESLTTSFRLLAENCGYQKNQVSEFSGLELAKTVYNRIVLSTRLLLIFDNAENEQMISSYYPDSSYTFHILITSNWTNWVNAKKISIHDYSFQQDSIDYLTRRLQDEDKEDIEMLAKRLHYFPLALEQAASTIGDILTIKEYLQDYNRSWESRKELLSEKGTIAELYKYTTFTTWEVAKNKLLQKNNIESLDLLKSCAWFYPDKIFLGLLGQARLVKTKIISLANFSLVEVINGDEKKDSIKLHRLLQEVIRIDILSSQEAEAPKFFEIALSYLNSLDYNRNNHEDLNKLQKNISHFNNLLQYFEQEEKDLNLSSETLKNVGALNLRIGTYYLDYVVDTAEAKMYLETAERIFTKTCNLSDEDRLVMEVFCQLGGLHAHHGKQDKAKEYLDRIKAINSGNLRDDMAIRAELGLINVYLKDSEFTKAEESINNVLKAVNLPDTYKARALHYYGSFYFSSGKIKRREVDKLKKQKHDAQLLLLYQNEQKELFIQAKYKFQESLAIKESFYKSFHKEIARTAKQAALACSALDEYKEANILYAKAYEHYYNYYLKAPHEDIIHVLCEWGESLGALQEVKLAHEKIQEALELTKKLNTYQKRKIFYNVGNIYYSLGKSASKNANPYEIFFTEAIANYENYFMVLMEAGVNLEKARAKKQIASSHFMLKDYQKSAAFHLQSLQYFCNAYIEDTTKKRIEIENEIGRSLDLWFDAIRNINGALEKQYSKVLEQVQPINNAVILDRFTSKLQQERQLQEPSQAVSLAASEPQEQHMIAQPLEMRHPLQIPQQELEFLEQKKEDQVASYNFQLLSGVKEKSNSGIKRHSEEHVLLSHHPEREKEIVENREPRGKKAKAGDYTYISTKFQQSF